MITFKQFLDEETLDDYSERLVRTLKIKKLGFGAYAQVFQHPAYHNVAVKVVLNDPMYLKYIKYCQGAQSNPWVPKIVSVHPIEVDKDFVWDRANSKVKGSIVFFQKLRKATAAEIKNATNELLDTVDPKWFRSDPNDAMSKAVFRKRSKFKTFDDFTAKTWVEIAKRTSDSAVRELAGILARVHADDIHNGNVMMRDEGDRSQLVFTDPVAS